MTGATNRATELPIIWAVRSSGAIGGRQQCGVHR
jgi:hypothetical protein